MDEIKEVMPDSAETLKKAAATITEEPIKIVVDVKINGIINRFLRRFKVVRDKRVFEIRPLTLGTLVRISGIVLAIDRQAFKNPNWLEGNYDLIQKHGYGVAKIIALAVTNSKMNPQKSLIEFFLYNLTPSELLSVLIAVIKMSDLQSFFLSLKFTRGMNILENQIADAKNAVEGNQTISEPILFGDSLGQL